MRKIILAIISALILTGCATRGPVKTLDVKSNEAIAVGKMKVTYNGEDITPKAMVLFNEIMWGTYSCKADETGFIALRLPVGANHIAWMQMKNFHITLPKDYATFDIPANSRIVYIGDMDIKWTGPKGKANMGAMFGAVGGLIDGMNSDGKIEISVSDKLGDNEQVFREKYKSDDKMVASIIKIKQ